MAEVVDKSVQQMQAAGARILHSSPGLAERMVASSSKLATKPMGAGRDERDMQIAELQRQLDSEKERNRNLEDQFKHRVATFAKRETQTKNKIELLERRLNDGPETDEHASRMDIIENMHNCVISGLECIQNNTAKILQDQEKDLMRAFRARLQEVSKDLEAQRSKKGEHSTELQAKHRRVVSELHEMQELASTFDKKNQQLTAENMKLQEKLRTREDDRQALLRELVLARKETARLKAQSKEGTGIVAPNGDNNNGLPEQSTGDMTLTMKKRSFSQKQIDQVRLQQTHNRQYEREVGYREAVTKLKRMVEAERKTVRALKAQQADMLQQRTELEVLLRQCLDDVKAEIARHRVDFAKSDTSGPTIPGTGPPIANVQVHELSTQDRERVLELLLSQQRVVQLLYSKTFAHPVAPPPENLPSTPPKGDTKEDDFSWLRDIIPGES